MKIISWNMNGLMPSLENGSFEPIVQRAPDILCLQEIRTTEEPVVLPGYRHYWNHGDKAGYSGVAVMSRTKPLSVAYDLPDDDAHDGRIITLEFEEYYVICVYVPNSQKNLFRHAYRRIWDQAFRDHVRWLLDFKPVIICGDFNVAREPIDIYEENLKQFYGFQGMATDERADFFKLMGLGFCDAFRELHPDERSYTWWSTRLDKRSENRGWRLDYFLVSEDLMMYVRGCEHLCEVTGSDHCPIELVSLV